MQRIDKKVILKNGKILSKVKKRKTNQQKNIYQK